MDGCYYKKIKNNKGFTLVELLVVIAILGILATIGLATFTSAQKRGRDAQRKSDLKQVASSLELYYSDHNSYPAGNTSTGQIKGCPSTDAAECVWGSGLTNSVFTDTKTTYFKTLPKDPSGNTNYYYRVVDPDATTGMGSKFQLFAHLENTQDPKIDLTISYSCGAGIPCNFSITSANTTSSE